MKEEFKKKIELGNLNVKEKYQRACKNPSNLKHKVAIIDVMA